MKLIYTSDELQQRSEQWVELRNTKIGASDVATLLGVNRYEKPITLYKRKIGRLKPKTVNAAMLRGVELEDAAVENLIQEIKFDGIENPQPVPYVCIHPKYSDIAVSFDGVDIQNGYIIEVKCPATARNFIAVFENGIPEHYRPQVQLQLFMSNEHWGITKAYFGSYYPDGACVTDYERYKEYFRTINVVEEYYDPKYCQAMCNVVDKFVANVRAKEWNDEEYNKVLEEFKNATNNHS